MILALPTGTVILGFLFASMIFWRIYTAEYLRSLGKDSDFHIGTMMGQVVLDFFRAIWAASSRRELPPLGVVLHGVSFVAFFVAIVWEARIASGQ